MQASISSPPHHLWEPTPSVETDNLYRLRIWVTHDHEARGDCQCQTFVCSIAFPFSPPPPLLPPTPKPKLTSYLPPQTFPTLDTLINATNNLKTSFSEAKISHRIKNCGVGCLDDEGRVDIGKMEAIAIEYESETSEESWGEFIGRLGEIKKGWVVDV